MPTTIDELTIFLRAVDKTKAPFGKVQKRIENMNKVTAVLAKGAAAASAAFVGGFTAAANNGKQITDELARMAQILGTTTNRADGLFQIIKGDTPSAEIDKVTEAVLTLQEGFFDARQESGPLFDLIKDFGADIDLSLDDPQAQLRNFLEEVQKLGNESDRVGTIIANLGADDAKPFLEYARNADAANDAIKALSGSLENVPGAIDSEDAKALEEYKRSSVELSNTWDQFSKQAFTFLTPTLSNMNKELAEGLEISGGLLAKVDEYFKRVRENRVSTNDLVAQETALDAGDRSRQQTAMITRTLALQKELNDLQDNAPDMGEPVRIGGRIIPPNEESFRQAQESHQLKILEIEKEITALDERRKRLLTDGIEIRNKSANDNRQALEDQIKQQQLIASQNTDRLVAENKMEQNAVADQAVADQAKINREMQAAELRLQSIQETHELEMRLSEEAALRKARSVTGSAGREAELEAERERQHLQIEHEFKLFSAQQDRATADVKAAEIKMQSLKDVYDLQMRLSEQAAQRDIQLTRMVEQQRLQSVAPQLYAQQGSRDPLEVNNAIDQANQTSNDALARLYGQQIDRGPQEIENAIGIVEADKMLAFAGQIDIVANAYGNLSRSIGQLAGNSSRAFKDFQKTSVAFARVAALTAAIASARSASFSANPFAAIAAYLNVGATLLSAVSAIQSVNESGGNVSLPSGSSQSSNTPSGPIGGTLQTPQPSRTRNYNFNVSGLDRNGIYEGDIVERLMEEAFARGILAEQ